METYTREQLIKADLKYRQMVKNQPNDFVEDEGEPTLLESAISIDFLLSLIE